MLKHFNKNSLVWLWLTMITIIVDQATKHYALKYLSYGQPVPVMPHFNLTLVFNTGSAFGFLGAAGGWQMFFFIALAIIVSIILCSWLAKLPKSQKWTACAVSLILGGAIGNLIDRIHWGHVVDFVQWYVGQWSWPMFNIADSAICIGAVMLIIEWLFFKDKSTN